MSSIYVILNNFLEKLLFLIIFKFLLFKKYFVLKPQVLILFKNIYIKKNLGPKYIKHKMKKIRKKPKTDLTNIELLNYSIE